MNDDGDNLLEALFACSPDAIVVVDEQGRIEMASAALETLFGYPVEDVIGRPVEMLVPDTVREAHQAYRTSYGHHPAPRPMGAGLELHGRRRDGSVFPVDVSLAPVDLDGTTSERPRLFGRHQQPPQRTLDEGCQ